MTTSSDSSQPTKLAGGLSTWTDEKERLYGNPPHPPQSTPECSSARQERRAWAAEGGGSNPPTQTIDQEARFCALVDNLAKPERIILSEHIQHIYRSGIAEERERCAAIARAWKLDPLLDDEGNMGDLADAIEETDRAK